MKDERAEWKGGMQRSERERDNQNEILLAYRITLVCIKS